MKRSTDYANLSIYNLESLNARVDQLRAALRKAAPTWDLLGSSRAQNRSAGKPSLVKRSLRKPWLKAQ
jgi:hypothetical protein